MMELLSKSKVAAAVTYRLWIIIDLNANGWVHKLFSENYQSMIVWLYRCIEVNSWIAELLLR